VNTLGSADDERAIARLAVQVWAEAVRNPALAARLSKAYRTVNTQLVRLITAFQQQGDIGVDVPARDLARLLAMLGPAFLLHRALLNQAVPGSFAAGLHGLLAMHDASRRPKQSTMTHRTPDE